MFDDKHCERCNTTHRTMEMCPNAPGYLELMRSWLTGDRTNPMAWAAVYLTVVDVFLLALAIFTLGR